MRIQNEFFTKRIAGQALTLNSKIFHQLIYLVFKKLDPQILLEKWLTEQNKKQKKRKKKIKLGVVKKNL